MADIELTDRQRAEVLDILRRVVPEVKVLVFGSRATGRAKPFSDLDLVFVAETSLPSGRVADLRDAFDESSLPFKVDLLQYCELRPEFRAIVDRDGVLLSEGTDL